MDLIIVRWNSTYYMLKRFKELKRAVRLFLQDHKPDRNEKSFDLIRDSLTLQDWQEIDLFLDLLKSFEWLTKHLQYNPEQDDTYGAIWEVIPSLQRLFVHLEKARKAVPEHASEYYKQCLLLGKEKLDQYWDILLHQTPYYIAATMVHPSLNLA